MKVTANIKVFIWSIFLCLFVLLKVNAAPPEGYYDSATGLAGIALRQALHEIIDDHEYLAYTDETRDVVAAADEDPNNSSNILDVYKNASYAKTNTTSWNQEHAWPKSYGFPDEASCNYPYTDCHHLFACDPIYNSTRGNIPFDFCLSDCTEYPVLPLVGGLANYRNGLGNTGSWEVWPGRRGDVARALLYLDVRYEGGTHGVTECAEPDLILTNNKNEITTTDENVSLAYMGVLDTLLQWHQMDSVDDKERHRNDVVYQNQGNRNPFIDHPEWAAEIWGIIATPTPTATPIIGTSPGDIVINEIDYDDPSIDTESFIELKNVSLYNIDLSTIQVVGFNGATSDTYFTFTPQTYFLPPGGYHVLGTENDSSDISEDIDETMTGVYNIQNGPDGIYLCLSDSPYTIIDSVSYEGDWVHPSGSSDSGNAGTDNPSSSFYSLSRIPDGMDTNDNSVDFVFQAATPGETNNAPTPTPTITPTPTPTPTITPTPTPTPTSTPTPTPTATSSIGISPGDIVINEIDYDDPGIDTETFIELKNVSFYSIDLSMIRVVGFNGATSDTYFTFTPQVYVLPPGGYHVLGTENDSSDISAFIDETMIGVSNIQNGPDGIYLRLSDSPYTIIDSVSYEGDWVHPSGSSDSGNAGTDNPSSSFFSLSRIPDGADTNDNSVDFVFQAATPGETNNAPTPTPTITPTPTSTPTSTPTPTATPGTEINPGDIVINEIDYEDFEIDAESFIELKNVSSNGIDLSDLQVNGLNGGTSTTYFTYRPAVKILLPGEFHVLGTESESSDVASFIDETMTGVTSLQNGPDGIFLSLFASQDTILDSVSYEGAFVHPSDSTDEGNAGEDLSTDDGISLSRIPDGGDTNDNSQDFMVVPHTPGTANVMPTPTPTPDLDPGDIVINEIDYNDPGIDDQSFLELKNISEKYIDLSTLQIVGISSGTTNLYFSYRLQSKSLSPGERHVLGTVSDSGAVAAFIDETMTGVSLIQNGPNDGVYLRLYYFPSIIIDSVSYEGDKAHPIGSPDSGDAGEDASTEDNVSLSRIPDGIDTDDNTSDFKIISSTPGGVNVTPTPTPLTPSSGFFLR